jgi:hypothetical protein
MAPRSSAQLLDAGKTVEVGLKPGGYVGDYTVTIKPQVRNEFGTNSNPSDPTGLPVRIRAAATALRDLGVEERFRISYRDRALRITRT